MHGPDWVLYRKCFQRGDDGSFHAKHYYSDAQYPAHFVVSSSLARSQAANEAAHIALSTMARPTPFPPPGLPSTEARHSA